MPTATIRRSRKQAKAAPVDAYLLHFERPYHHAQHYLGSSKNLPLRLVLHSRGQSRVGLLQAVRAAGIAWTVARVWYGNGRELEQKFKRAGHNRDLCPICHPELDPDPEPIPF